jgi:hypothetical protein
MTLNLFSRDSITSPTRDSLIISLLACSMIVSSVSAQYVGFVYPAGGQRGTTFRITIGGQSLAGVDKVLVSGNGVTGRVIEYNKKMNPQEMQLIGEQLRELRLEQPPQIDPLVISNMINRIERLSRENVQTPACASIANLVIAEITVEPNASAGLREIRLCTPRGVSNPLVFNVGQLPEISAPTMVTCPLVTLGKEEQSLRKKKRDQKSGGSDMMMEGMMMGSAGAQSEFDDDEVCVTLPCTLNGQIAQGSVDRYRFAAKKGQRIVVIVQARELVPYMADAVPGWFQPVLVLCNSKGKEVSYVDDYFFKPDPVMLYEVQEDGEYHLAIYDSIYRGREDFVYRITVGEIPFITSIFPMGARAGETVDVAVKGWNLGETSVTPFIKDPVPGVYQVTARGKGGLISNPMPFALDTLPECMEKEPNSQLKTAQKVALPIIINGSIDNPGKKDIFQFQGRTGDDVVAEVFARRLNSPLDSVLKLTDAAGKILATNDDREDSAAGINTHHADSYIRTTLPSDGTFYVHLEDTQHKSGSDYVYRLRISQPQPDFAIRLVPSMVIMRSNSTASVKAFILRQDGFTNDITFAIKGNTNNFSAMGRITGTQPVTQVTIKTSLPETVDPACIVLQGIATNKTQKWVREAVPAEDRMQAFLWRHLVPAQEMRALVFNPPPPPPPPPKEVKKEATQTEQKKVNFPQGLMVHFNFDQWESGNTITDRTGRNNNGRAVYARWNANGKQSGCYEFSPTNGYIQVKDSTTLNSKTATYASWFKAAKPVTADRYIFEKQKDNGFALCLAGAPKDAANKGKLRFVVNNMECLGDSNVVDGAWHHVTAVFNGETLKLYVDGQPQNNVTPWKGEIGVNTNSLSIGMNRTNPSLQEKTTGFDGFLDEVMIFDHALSDEEVKVVLSSTKPKFTKGQVANRLAELKELYERDLLIQSFYERRVKECEVTP